MSECTKTCDGKLRLSCISGAIPSSYICHDDHRLECWSCLIEYNRGTYLVLGWLLRIQGFSLLFSLFPLLLCQGRGQAQSASQNTPGIARMDPLSIIASCIAIGTLVQQTSQAIADLRALIEELPQRLCAVKNEVNDIGLLVSRVQDFAERRQRFQESIFEAADCDVTDLLEKAQINLTTLQIIVSGLATACRKESSKMSFLNARTWKQKHPQIEKVQREMASIKSTLSVVLQAANS